MSTVKEMPTLESLERLAGASDKNRPAWLAQRALGVTATEIRDLHTGAKRTSDLVADKLGRTSNSFAGNRYTAWGNEREPVIAELVRWRYAIAPESRLFRSATNPRFLCSPDGLGADISGAVLGSEIKTAGMNIARGTAAFDKKGYLFQIVWAMVVTGARRWLYVWEERLEVDGVFEPGELHFEWIDWDDEIAAIADVLVAEAEAFLAALDAAAAAEYVEPSIDDELDTHAVNYLRFHADEKAATEAKKTAWSAMLARLEGCDEVRQEGATARVTYNPGVDVEKDVPDVEAAKQADPALFAEVEALSKRWNAHQAQYVKTTTVAGRPHLTVTSVKPVREKK